MLPGIGEGNVKSRTLLRAVFGMSF
eukprot:COSAG06_NODE_40465_length_401_cov_8.880795_1_plen_24_part_10